jgi:hypothetical protein
MQQSLFADKGRSTTDTNPLALVAHSRLLSYALTLAGIALLVAMMALTVALFR